MDNRIGQFGKARQLISESAAPVKIILSAIPPYIKGITYGTEFVHSSKTGFAGLISSPSARGMMMSRKDVAISFRASKGS
jgi:hypothetical protein